MRKFIGIGAVSFVTILSINRLQKNRLINDSTLEEFRVFNTIDDLIPKAHCFFNINQTNSKFDSKFDSNNNHLILIIENNLKKLKKIKFNVNEKCKFGWTPLHVAVANNQLKFVEYLINIGANQIPKKELDFRDEFFSSEFKLEENYSGFSPLHYAALNDNLEIVELLLKSGADCRLKNDYGHKPIVYTDNKKIMELLEKYEQILQREDRKKYPLNERLSKKLIGQLLAINTVSNIIRRKESGWYDEEHPLVLMFLGSSGTGKTELAKQLANYLSITNDDNDMFIRIDMSEYQEKHEVAKFIGSPPGYVGHEEGGQLTKGLMKNPKAIVLFDEIEKAHPDLLTILLQLFDEGRLTDGRGQSIKCNEAIFIMTSNLASNEIADHIVELREKSENYNSKTEISRKFYDNVVKRILKKHFRRDEFLGRINEFVYFLPFNQVELRELIEKELIFWKKKAESFQLQLNWDEKAINRIVEGYDINYGARSIKHEIERRIINRIAEVQDLNTAKPGSKILITTNKKNEINLKIN
ncbi:hypothetical protein SNEBB_003559 [Seison nebaliae]|nr:hypothetical protein SNEBB_003559 [Seison nebaliae]